MRGHLRERGPDRWALVVDLGRDPVSGKRKQKWVTVHGTKRQAQRRLNELLTEIQAGGYVAPAKQTVADYLEEWLTAYVPSQVKASSVQTYGSLMRSHVIPRLGAVRLGELKATQIARLYQQLLATGARSGGALSPATVGMVHTILSSALSYGVRLGVLSSNPAAKVSPPRLERQEAAVLTQEQVQQLLEEAASRSPLLHLVVLIAVTTGLRRGELLGLRWQDVDLDQRRLVVSQTVQGHATARLEFSSPKTAGSRRVVECPDVLIRALREHRAAQAAERQSSDVAHASYDLVLCRPDGGPLRPNGIGQQVVTLLAELGLPGSLHTLRHTHATLLLVAGVHAKIVSGRLGHSTVQITLDRYSHIIPGLDRGAADQLDNLLQGTQAGPAVDSIPP